MKTTDQNRMAAPCGIYCEICPLALTRDNPGLMEAMVARGIPRENLPCPGCRDVKGVCPVLGAGVTCQTYRCAAEKGVEFCYECAEFPCNKLNPAAHRADLLPHNTKVFHLCYMKQHGLEAWKEKAADIQNRYYKGVMKVGEGPVLGYLPGGETQEFSGSARKLP